jgi:hypothetical protein
MTERRVVEMLEGGQRGRTGILSNFPLKSRSFGESILSLFARLVSGQKWMPRRYALRFSSRRKLKAYNKPTE